MIQPTGAARSDTQPLPAGTADPVQILEKQKALLEEQVQRVREGKQEPQTKQEKIKALQEQIQQIDQQIQQKRMEKVQKAANAAKEEPESASGNPPQPLSKNATPQDTAIQDLMAASASLSQARQMNVVRQGLQGEANVLNIEIKQDQGRGNTQAKLERIQEIRARQTDLEEKTAQTLGKAQKHIESSQANESAARPENRTGVSDEEEPDSALPKSSSEESENKDTRHSSLDLMI